MATIRLRPRLFQVAPALVAVALAAGFSGTAARAQTVSGFALDRFEPAGGGSDWFTLESLDLRGKTRPAVGLTGNWAWKPLVIYNQDGTENTALVRHQLFTHLNAAINLWSRARVGLGLPVALYQSGETGTLGGLSYGAARDAGLGDLRATVDVRLFGNSGDRITMAAGTQLFFPTGREQQYLGDAGVRVAPRILMAGAWGGVAYALRLGYRYRVEKPSVALEGAVFQGVAANSEVTGGAGLGYRFSPAALVGVELSATTVAGGGRFFERRSTPVELLLGGHFTVRDDWRIGLGVVPGITDGIGAPTLRVVGQIEYFPAIRAATAVRQSPEPPLPPAPRRPLPSPVPPPPPPAVVPPPPPAPDKDQDGIVDAEDACHDLAGVKTDSPETNGCPPPEDKDQDQIVDSEDACPDHVGPKDPDPKKNGCPVVRIESGQVRIVEQVKFKTNSAVILKQSHYVLDEVVKLLTGHTEIMNVRIEGHTDNRGKAKRNKALSARRAASVMKWIVKHGIDKRRLTSAGFGSEKPIATNKTDDGRRENRRVEFHIADSAAGNGAPQTR